MGRTLKDSFRFNRYSTYRQEKDRECFCTLCPLFFASTAFVVTNAIIQLSICRRFARLDIFAFCEIYFTKRQIRYAFDTLRTPKAHSSLRGTPAAQARYDIDPRSRSEHIELLMAHSCHQQYIERASVYRRSAQADLYRRVVSLWALR